MSDIREALARIKASVEEATEGPWITWKEFPFSKPSVCTDDGQEVIGECPDDLNAASYEQADATFISHARTDVPRLAEALEAVLNELDRCDDGIKIEYVHRGRRTRTPDDEAVERMQAVRSAEREAARRIRAAITNALTEEEQG